MAIHLVHGFNVWDGGFKTVGKLRRYVEHLFDVKEIKYGWTGLAGVRFKNPKVADKLVKIANGDIGIGHSNGCAILQRAVTHGAKYEILIFINPALNKEARVPIHSSVKRVYVLYSPDDEPVKWAKWLRKFSPLSWFDPHPWGEMGRVGYCGVDDKRYISINKCTGRLPSCEHSDMFNGDRIDYWGDYIRKLLVDEISH